MTTLFLSCAAVGSSILLFYFVVGMFGHGDSADGHDVSAGHHHDGGDAGAGGLFLAVLSLRSLSAAVAAFGLAGMAAQSAGYPPAINVAAGGGAGLAAMSLVVFLLRSLRKLSDSGTVELDRAVDQIATVYVPIPGMYNGSGKVTLDLQNRTVELAAVTHGPALPTGSRVRVVQMVDNQTAEVASIGM